MRCKEVIDKHGLAETSVIAMRSQVGVSKAQIVRSRDFRHAVKTMLAKDVAAEFRLGMSVVLKHRRQLGVNRKPAQFLNRLPAFIHDVITIYSATEVARKWHCTDTYVHSVRRQIKRRELI
jgi:hypothetical protein